MDKHGNEKLSKPIRNTTLSMIEKVFNYEGIETDIIDEDKYNYITIFGISNDKIMHKYIITVIIDGENIYREEYITYDKIHVKIIEGEIKYFILKLIE